MTSKSSIHLLIFYMQSKEMFKLTPQLCRLAKQEYHETMTSLPHDVREDNSSFEKVLQLIDHVENSEFALASEILSDAYREHEEMIGHLPKKPKSRTPRTLTESPSIFEEGWQPPTVRAGEIPTPPAVTHNLNEDDSRNWNNNSPVVSKDYNNMEPNKEEGTGDSNYRRTYMTTLRRPAEGRRHDYETVYVSSSPAVLADKFTDLYKEEWKSAMDELSTVLGDKQTIRHLLWIIAKSSIICASLATQQLQDVENSVVGIMVSRDPLNKASIVDEPLSKKNEQTVSKARNILIDYRREMSKLSIPMLQKEIRRSIASELGTSLPRRFTGIGNHFITYSEKCIELVWLMYVHDPPVHLEWLTREQEGTAFKEELYEPYTRPGTLYDYCVWPVVRLHRNGPVLCKGIAQGR